MYLLQYAWKGIGHKPLGALMAALSGMLGVALLVFLWQVEKKSQHTLEENLIDVDLIVGAKGSPLQLVLAGLYQTDAPTGNIPFAMTKPYLSGKHPVVGDALPLSMGDSYKGYRLVGSQNKIVDWYSAKLAEGRNFKAPMEVVLGAETAAELDITLGATFESNHGLLADEGLLHEHTPYTVVGILAPTGKVIDRLVLTALESYWMAHAPDTHAPEAHAQDAPTPDTHTHTHEAHEEEDSHQEITVLLCRYKNHNALALSLANLINKNTDFQAAMPALEMNRLYLQLGQGTELLKWMARILFIVSALSLWMSLLIRLSDRQSELALLRSLGASPQKLLGLTLIEGVLIALTAVLSGLILGHLGLWLAQITKALGSTLVLEPWQWHPLETWLLPLAVFIGLLAALFPALKAYRIPIQTVLSQK